MEKYSIRYAGKEDIPAILKYIDEKWLKNHWLVREPGVFEWQYTSDKLDFIIGENEEGEIKGIMGYISYDDDDNRDIALSMWMANPEDGFLGAQLLSYLMNQVSHRVLFSPGINTSTTERIYKIFGIGTGKMNQWYRLSSRSKYEIAVVRDKSIKSVPVNTNVSVVRYTSFDEMTRDFNHEKHVKREYVPYKSLSYINRRYFMHPSYSYLVFGVKPDGNETEMVIVLRVQEYNGSKVLRFVDLLGNVSNLKCATSFIDNLMLENDCEYVDTFEVGVDEEELILAGWDKITEVSANIIPNYFNPFVQKNIEIHYCSTDKNIVMFKGDGDQDRPK